MCVSVPATRTDWHVDPDRAADVLNWLLDRVPGRNPPTISSRTFPEAMVQQTSAMVAMAGSTGALFSIFLDRCAEAAKTTSPGHVPTEANQNIAAGFTLFTPPRHDLR